MPRLVTHFLALQLTALGKNWPPSSFGRLDGPVISVIEVRTLPYRVVIPNFDGTQADPPLLMANSLDECNLTVFINLKRPVVWANWPLQEQMYESAFTYE